MTSPTTKYAGSKVSFRLYRQPAEMTPTDQIAKAICDAWLWPGAWEEHIRSVDRELFRRLARAVQEVRLNV